MSLWGIRLLVRRGPTSQVCDILFAPELSEKGEVQCKGVGLLLEGSGFFFVVRYELVVVVVEK